MRTGYGVSFESIWGKLTVLSRDALTQNAMMLLILSSVVLSYLISPCFGTRSYGVPGVIGQKLTILPQETTYSLSDHIGSDLILSHFSQIYLRGPYGTPAHEFTRTEHAVLVAAGIGVTPCASLLQSLLIRRRRIQSGAMQQQEDFKLKKVNKCSLFHVPNDFAYYEARDTR